MNEIIWEDICNVLTSGEIPGYLSKEEQDAIGEQILEESKKETDDPDTKPFEYFTRKIKDNLHMVITMNPQHKLRERMRAFP